MKKFRKLLAVALLTAPIMTLGASTISDAARDVQAKPMQSVTACCFVYMNGRWWCFPC